MSAPVLATYIREADFAVRRPWSLGPRRLRDYLLVSVQEGEFVATVGGAEHRFVPGDVCLIQPRDVHTLEGRTNTITPYAHLDLVHDPAEPPVTLPARLPAGPYQPPRAEQPRLDELFGIAVPVRFRPPDPARFRETLIRMISVWQQGDLLSILEAHALATGLVLEILKAYGSALPRTRPGPDSLNWVTSYLMFHLTDPLSVADMAARAGRSPSRFAAIFRQRFGCPPHRYLRRLRIAHVQDLLASTDLTLEDIAARSGFANAQHLATAFRQETGGTPGAYRRDRGA